jgi:group I intron endonuclease
MGIIYKITNKINNKVYIGQTIQGMEKRWKNHLYYALKLKKDNKLARAIRKYGENAFLLCILEETNELDDREIYYISLYKSNTRGYNTKIGGSGGPHTDDTKNKISKANKKRIWTQEMKENMSKAIKQWHSKRGFVPKSDEFKRKISIANTGRKISKKTKEKFQHYNQSKSKIVICITNNTEYESIKSACRALKLNHGHLGSHLKGKHKSVKGFVFKLKYS